MHNIRISLLAICTLFSGCAVGDTAQFPDMSFPALAGGEQASIVHIDGSEHAMEEPIDFLKGQKLIALKTDTLDNVVTCEEDLANKGEFELKYYRNKVMKQTFHLQNASEINWMVLLPKQNCLIVEAWSPNESPPIIRFDLITGARKEMVLRSTISGQDHRLINTNPIWDSEAGNLIVYVSDDEEDFWARLNPDDLTITKIVPSKRGIGEIVVQTLLDYDKTNNSVLCYGMVGEPPLYTYHGKKGIYAVSLDTGNPRLIMEDTKPANVNTNALLKT